MNDADIRLRLMVSTQRALLFAVPPSLRAVTCGWQGTEVKLRFIFDGPISEDDQEGAQIVGTEVIADFPSPWTIAEEIERLDHPTDLRAGALPLWVFARMEKTTGGVSLY
ncbi:hypothetical protein [Brevundimonas sp.]|uniref:hypothetical protein n=1 Tax=Brevundimonas sp. TaxID=1871086 RepID=UPI002D6EEA6B|nr:hypothetical protein [Brevundimonas sp.]HYC74661.1 hypothetical protein [Brevundimonas sp.]